MSMPSRFTFTVQGTPKGQPRTASRVISPKDGSAPFAHIYTPNRKTKTKGSTDGFKQMLSIAARRAGLPSAPWEGPVCLTITAYFERPQRLLKSSSPAGPIPFTGKPDRDNLDKLVMDVLKRCRLYLDDAQVYDGPVRKFYVAKGGAPGVVVVAEHINPEFEQLSLLEAQ